MCIVVSHMLDINKKKSTTSRMNNFNSKIILNEIFQIYRKYTLHFTLSLYLF